MSKTGRNAPCPCGSGKKYKKCCLSRNASVRHSGTEEGFGIGLASTGAPENEPVYEFEQIKERISEFTVSETLADIANQHFEKGADSLRKLHEDVPWALPFLAQASIRFGRSQRGASLRMTVSML